MYNKLFTTQNKQNIFILSFLKYQLVMSNMVLPMTYPTILKFIKNSLCKYNNISKNVYKNMIQKIY